MPLVSVKVFKRQEKAGNAKAHKRFLIVELIQQLIPIKKRNPCATAVSLLLYKNYAEGIRNELCLSGQLTIIITAGYIWFC